MFGLRWRTAIPYCDEVAEIVARPGETIRLRD
jgi:hypothetical protein